MSATTSTARIAKRIRMRRYKQRLAGLMAPVPFCRRCGHQCQIDTYLPFCGSCALRLGAPGTQNFKARDQRQAAAMQLLWDLRVEGMK